MKTRTLLTMMVLVMAFAPLALADGAPITVASAADLEAALADAADLLADEEVAEVAVVTESLADADRIPQFDALPEIVFVQGPIPGPGGPGGGGGGGGGGGNYNCSVTITCPGGTVGTHTIDPYQLSCSGYNSCSKYPNSSNPYAVVCDGIGTCCFPDSNGC